MSSFAQPSPRRVVSTGRAGVVVPFMPLSVSPVVPRAIPHLDTPKSPPLEPRMTHVPHVPLGIRFGMRLRNLRQARGMTQMQVAVAFGIDRTFLSDLERGRKSLSLPFLEVFALGFGLTLSELLREL